MVKLQAFGLMHRHHAHIIPVCILCAIVSRGQQGNMLQKSTNTAIIFSGYLVRNGFVRFTKFFDGIKQFLDVLKAIHPFDSGIALQLRMQARLLPN